MADIAHTAEHHVLEGSSAPSGKPPRFECVADRSAPNSRGQRDAEQVALIRHAHRVAATAQENNTEVDRLCDLQTRLETEGPRRPKKPAQPPLRQTIVDTSTATETVLTVTNPKGRDPAWIEWQRAVDEAEAAFARDQAAFGKAIGLDDQNRVCDRLHDKLVHQAQALTVMESRSPVALAAKANAWIEVMAAGGGDQWDGELVMSIAQDAVQIGIHGSASILAERGVSKPEAVSGRAPDRRALEAYREWLEMERRLLAIELYPDMGEDAVDFIPCNTAARNFHFGGGHDWRELPQPSTRAEHILSILGIDWTSEDEGKSAGRRNAYRNISEDRVPIVGEVA